MTTAVGDADEHGVDLSRVPEMSVPPHVRHLVADAERCFRLADQAGDVRSERMLEGVGAALLSLADADDRPGEHLSQLRLRRALDAFIAATSSRWVDYSVLRRLAAALRAHLRHLVESGNLARPAVRRAARHLRRATRRAARSVRSFEQLVFAPNATSVSRLVSSLSIAASAPPHAFTV